MPQGFSMLDMRASSCQKWDQLMKIQRATIKDKYLSMLVLMVALLWSLPDCFGESQADTSFAKVATINGQSIETSELLFFLNQHRSDVYHYFYTT